MQDRQDDNQRPKARVSSSTPSYPIPEVSSFVVILLGMLVPVVVIVPVVVRECVSKKKRRRRVWGEGSWRVGGEWTWGVGTDPLFSPPSSREKTRSRNRDRLADTGENQPHRPEPGAEAASDTGFLPSPQVLFQNLPSKSLSLS